MMNKTPERRRPRNLPSLVSLFTPEALADLSPEARERVLANKAMEGWSPEGDAWLHQDVLSEEK